MAIKKRKKKPEWDKVAKYLARVKKDIAELEKKDDLTERVRGQLAIIRTIEQILKIKF